jgi:hypothetical protein
MIDMMFLLWKVGEVFPASMSQLGLAEGPATSLCYVPKRQNDSKQRRQFRFGQGLSRGGKGWDEMLNKNRQEVD